MSSLGLSHSHQIKVTIQRYGHVSSDEKSTMYNPKIVLFFVEEMLYKQMGMDKQTHCNQWRLLQLHGM